MLARPFGMVPRRAVFAAAVLSVLSPWPSHAAVEFAQLAPPENYSRQANPPPRQPDAGAPAPNAIRPPTSAQTTPQTQNPPRGNAPSFTQPINPTDALRRAQELSSPLQGGIVRNPLPPANPTDALRRAQEPFSPPQGDILRNPLPPANPTDALRRAQELSSPPRSDLTPRDLSGQINGMGSAIPDTQISPAVPIQDAARSVVIAPPARRVIAPLPQIGNRRAGSGVPPANENRMSPDEVVVEVTSATSPQAIAALHQRHRLAPIEQLPSQLSGTTILRSRIQDGRSVIAVVRELEADIVVMSAQPNYRFALQRDNDASPKRDDEPLQYALAKLRLPQAHEFAKGDNVLVAIIDSGVDVSHPELDGAIAATFDAIDGSGRPHSHGTAIAGLIVAHAKLMGSAPAARILAVRAFASANANGEGSTFSILKGLDWAAVNGARVINMSFAGPSDPAIRRSLEAAYKNAIVLVAAAGNAGPKSPPLYPAADPYVIAVTATDAEDKFFAASNRGPHIAVAAPGVDILVAVPDGGYQILSGTSFSAAEVSGIAALMIGRRPNLTASAVRGILLATAKTLLPEGRDDRFSPRLADAYEAISASAPPLLTPAAMRESNRPINAGR